MQIACKDILRDIISKGKFVMGITFLKNAFLFSPIENLTMRLRLAFFLIRQLPSCFPQLTANDFKNRMCLAKKSCLLRSHR